MSKNLNSKTLLAIFSVMALMTACQPKSDDSVASTPLFQNCTGCGAFAQGLLYSAGSQGPEPVTVKPVPSIQATFSVYGDSVRQQQLLLSGGSMKSYSGPLFLNGAMDVNTPVTAGYCVIPAGHYQFQTVTVGQAQAGYFTVPMIQAIGPVQLMFSVVDGVPLDPDADGAVNRVSVQLNLLQGPLGTGGVPSLGGFSNCNDSIGLVLL